MNNSELHSYNSIVQIIKMYHLGMVMNLNTHNNIMNNKLTLATSHFSFGHRCGLQLIQYTLPFEL